MSHSIDAPPVRGVLLPGRVRLALFAVAGASIATLLTGLLLWPAASWPGLLVASFFLLTVALGGVVFLALNCVGKAGWHVVLKRIAEGLAVWLPIGAVTMIIVLLGVRWLYPWADPALVAADEAMHGRSGWLNVPFFAARTIGVLALWTLFAALLRRGGRRVGLAAGFLVFFAVSFSMACFDWLMSVDAHWASTAFAWYHLAGLLQGGVAAITVVAVILQRRGHLPEVNADHFHDLGKLLFGFSTLWAYLWFFQYMLIWYANIPEEIEHYLVRFHGGWSFLFWINVLLGWGLPFLALLPRPSKRDPANLLKVGLAVLLARWLDVYQTVVPSLRSDHTGFSPFEIAAAVGLGAAFILVLDRALAARPLVDRSDPFLAESLHHHV